MNGILFWEFQKIDQGKFSIKRVFIAFTIKMIKINQSKS